MGASMKLNSNCPVRIEMDDAAEEKCVYESMLKLAKKLDTEVFGTYKEKDLYVMPYDSIYRIQRRYHGLDKD